ncbi:hypothetical protein OG21DRAFT_1525887 [Imleria badia]|nr:hypothetical protein OG21DRAFT_1525887 [Imleria badia]
MPPRQRAVSRTVGGDSTRSLQVAGQERPPQADAGKKKLVGAFCHRCEQSGLTDICQLKETTTRSTNTSILPSEPQATQGKHRSHGASTSRSSIPPTSKPSAPTSQPKVSTKDKDMPEDMGPTQMKSAAPSSQKRSMPVVQPTLDDAAQVTYLNSITEFDDSYSPVTFDEDDEDANMDIPMFPMEALRNADHLLSVMTTGTSKPEYTTMDVDEGQSEMSSENFNLEDIQDTSNNDDDSDIALDDLLQQRCPSSKPVVAAVPQAH